MGSYQSPCLSTGSFTGNLRKLCYTTARTHERVGIPERTPAVQTLPSLNVHPAEVCLECHVRTYHLSCQGARHSYRRPSSWPSAATQRVVICRRYVLSTLMHCGEGLKSSSIHWFRHSAVTMDRCLGPGNGNQLYRNV
jgi:thymidylate kinase